MITVEIRSGPELKKQKYTAKWKNDPQFKVNLNFFNTSCLLNSVYIKDIPLSVHIKVNILFLTNWILPDPTSVYHTNCKLCNKSLRSIFERCSYTTLIFI